MFFVLSGLVLSRAYLQTGDASIIARGALKRWPRLAGPVVLVVVASALIDHLGLYRFDQAAGLTGSPWLAGHLFRGVAFADRGFFGAFGQGILTFFRGDSSYDTSLWTMRYEMTGSYLVFGLALILGQVRARAGAAIYLLIVYLLIYSYLDATMLAFLAGVAIAHVQVIRPTSLPLAAGVTLTAVGFFLLGYSGLDAGWYGPLASSLHGIDKLYVHILAAAMIIVAADGTPAIRHRLEDRWSVFLGWISFPVYLVHIPVLCSVGCSLFLLVLPMAGPRTASLCAFLGTILGSIAVAVPLALLNDRWTAAVDRITKTSMGRPHGERPLLKPRLPENGGEVLK